MPVEVVTDRGGSSSVTANCPCADQGGRRARMVVGADYPDRAGLGGVRDAGTSPPLMPPRRRPGHGWRRGVSEVRRVMLRTRTRGSVHRGRRGGATDQQPLTAPAARGPSYGAAVVGC